MVIFSFFDYETEIDFANAVTRRTLALSHKALPEAARLDSGQRNGPVVWMQFTLSLAPAIYWGLDGIHYT
jgi:hypothetical protein